MYLQTNFNVLKDFRRVIRKSFGSDTKEVDFEKNSEKARRIINNWVEKRTSHKIIQMIGPGKYVSHNNNNIIVYMFIPLYANYYASPALIVALHFVFMGSRIILSVYRDYFLK